MCGFEFDENKPPKEGEMIKCDNCGQLNDFSAIKNLCVNKKVEEIKDNFKGKFSNLFFLDKVFKIHIINTTLE